MSEKKSAVKATAARTICVVDDDPAIRDSLVMLLSARGYAVSSYGSAADYLTAQDGHPNCGCLLIDHHMPKMSGLDLLDELRARRLTTPTIIMTGRSDSMIVNRAMQAGALAVLDKPIARNDLLKWIDQALASGD